MGGIIDWFEGQVASVKMRKFFVIEGPGGAPRELQLRSFEREHGPLPDDYREFISRYGSVKLFRRLESGTYALRLHGLPLIYTPEEGLDFAEIGSVESRLVYYAKEPQGRFAPTVLEHSTGVAIREAGDSFSEWLPRRCESLKHKYTADEWHFLQVGAAPFSADEIRAVHNRAQFSVEKVGADQSNNVLLAVRNESSARLRYLTVLLRDTGESGIEAHTPVFVGDVGPGESRVIRVAFYKEYAEAASVEIVPLAEPLPEDRYIYFELTGPEWYRRRLLEGRKMPSENTATAIPTHRSLLKNE